MSTWATNAPQDEDRFFDFVVEAFKNNDKTLSFEVLRAFAEEIEDRILENFEIESLGKYEAQYKDGIILIAKYKNVE